MKKETTSNDFRMMLNMAYASGKAYNCIKFTHTVQFEAREREIH